MNTVLKPHSSGHASMITFNLKTILMCSIHFSEYNVTCVQSDLSILPNQETYLLNNIKAGILYPEIENIYTF